MILSNFRSAALLVASTFIICTSCETEESRRQRWAEEGKQRKELQQKLAAEEAEKARKTEQEQAEKTRKLEQEKARRAANREKELQEKAVYDKYISNSLKTGAAPYAYCYRKNKPCKSSGCSKITVRSPSNSDVLVTLKRDGKVFRHAYIRSNATYTLEVPNGTYQPFFYYGKGWNPDKVMKEAECGTLKGGFISAEHVGKDDPQQLTSMSLEYTLTLQEHGNFTPTPSSQLEAL